MFLYNMVFWKPTAINIIIIIIKINYFKFLLEPVGEGLLGTFGGGLRSTFWNTHPFFFPTERDTNTGLHAQITLTSNVFQIFRVYSFFIVTAATSRRHFEIDRPNENKS